MQDDSVQAPSNGKYDQHQAAEARRLAAGQPAKWQSPIALQGTRLSASRTFWSRTRKGHDGRTRGSCEYSRTGDHATADPQQVQTER